MNCEILRHEKKDCRNSPFLFIIFPLNFYRFTHIQTRKPLYYHENSQQVSVIIQAVSVFVSYPPFIDSIFHQTNTPFSQNRQYPTPFYLSVLYYHGNPRLLRESILLPDSTIFPQSPSYQRHQKTQK